MTDESFRKMYVNNFIGYIYRGFIKSLFQFFFDFFLSLFFLFYTSVIHNDSYWNQKIFLFCHKRLYFN